MTMIREDPNVWSYFKLYVWLEFKKWTRFSCSGSAVGLFLYIYFSLLSFTYLNLSLYKPLWSQNPREVVIGGLLVLFVGFFLLSLQNSIFPMDGTGTLLPANPFHFDSADINIVSLSSGSPFSWALIGFFRTSIKSLWFSTLFFGITAAYCIENQFPLINILFVIALLFIGFQVTTFSGAFVYVLVEEFLEKKRPRWREKNYSIIMKIGILLTVLILFGGIWFLLEAINKGILLLDQVALDLWYLPPFNIIYGIVGFLSKSWPQNIMIYVLLSILIQWLIGIIAFFAILGKIDPLARLHERQMMVEVSLIGNETSLSLPFLAHLKSFFQKYIPNSFCSNQIVIEIRSLMYKDLLLFWKYKQLSGYAISLLVSYSMLLIWLFDITSIFPPLLLLPMFWSLFFTLFLWRMESKAILWNYFNVSKIALLLEKCFISFFIIMTIHFPLYLIKNEFIFTSIGIGLYCLIFVLGIFIFLFRDY